MYIELITVMCTKEIRSVNVKSSVSCNNVYDRYTLPKDELDVS